MAKKGGNYKSIKILEETHITLSDYAKLQGITMADVLHSLVQFAAGKNMPLARLIKNFSNDSESKETRDRIEFIIALLKNIEKESIIPTYHTAGRIEQEISFITSNMKINMIEETDAPEINADPPKPQENKSTILEDNKEILEYKDRAERAELRLNETVTALQEIYNKIGETSGGYRRVFEKDEYIYLGNLIKKCTQPLPQTK